MYQCLKDKTHDEFTSDYREINTGRATWSKEGDLLYTEEHGTWTEASSEILCAVCGSSVGEVGQNAG